MIIFSYGTAVAWCLSFFLFYNCFNMWYSTLQHRQLSVWIMRQRSPGHSQTQPTEEQTGCVHPVIDPTGLFWSFLCLCGYFCFLLLSFILFVVVCIVSGLICVVLHYFLL